MEKQLNRHVTGYYLFQLIEQHFTWACFSCVILQSEGGRWVSVTGSDQLNDTPGVVIATSVCWRRH